MKSFSRFAIFLTSLQKSLRPFSSTPSPLKSFADRRNDVMEESPAYLQSMLRRPPTLNPQYLLKNSCSFIGTVIRPGYNARSGAYTTLEVKTSSRGSDPPFKILLEMRGKLSEISLRYLKPKDYIYVHGTLNSYEKVDASGKRVIFYKVAVAEWNFVTHNATNQIGPKPDSAGADVTVGTSSAGENDSERLWLDKEERYRERMQLWQVFFVSPHEWWDNRKGKRTTRMPDFKHKDTGECLWLDPDDPPWVRKQLQLYDSSMERRRHGQADAFEWKIKDYV